MRDLIFYNARVITMDPARPEAELVVIRGNRIVSISGNRALERFKTPGTKVVDCAGQTLLPGFIDAHCHVHAYAESFVSLNLSPREHIHSISDIQDKIRAFSKNQTPGTWIRGKGYDEYHIAEKRHPNRWDLDVAAPLHPVKLTHRSGHAHVLNSLALAQTHIAQETGDPPGGFIDRELHTGTPTGILYGMGEYLAGTIPFVEDREIERGLGLAEKNLISCGITSVQDASSVNRVRQWRRFESWKARKIFQPRLTMMTGLKGFSESQQTPFVSEIDSEHLRSKGVKIIVHNITGTIQPSRDELNTMILAIHKAGLQAVVHAVEEPEIEAACDAIDFALRLHPRQDSRHRIEHCSVCPPSLLKRLAGLGITVVTQPSFIYFSGDRYLKKVPGHQRENLYAIGSMLKSGLRIGFSSDSPISDPNPMIGIQAAVTRMTESNQTVLPQQGIQASEALQMYTLGAATACFEEKIKGSVTPGKLADLVLLSEDPRTIDAGHIKDIRVTMTMLDGRVIWSDPARAPRELDCYATKPGL